MQPRLKVFISCWKMPLSHITQGCGYSKRNYSGYFCKQFTTVSNNLLVECISLKRDYLKRRQPENVRKLRLTFFSVFAQNPIKHDLILIKSTSVYCFTGRQLELQLLQGQLQPSGCLPGPSWYPVRWRSWQPQQAKPETAVPMDLPCKGSINQ